MHALLLMAKCSISGINCAICTQFRQENESVVTLKGLTPSGMLPFNVLQQGGSGIREGVWKMSCMPTHLCCGYTIDTLTYPGLETPEIILVILANVIIIIATGTVPCSLTVCVGVRVLADHSFLFLLPE